MKDERYDFTLYTEIEDMIGYNGFITKEGGFYRVGEYENFFATHDEWASMYLKEKNISIQYPSAAYQLIKDYHFVSVHHFEHLGFVFSDNLNYTESQKLLIEDLQEQVKTGGIQYEKSIY